MNCRTTRTVKGLRLGVVIAVAALFSSGCVIPKGHYRNMLIWEPIPATSSIQARAALDAECLLSPDMHQLWKALMNPDVNIVNYREAFCDGVFEDMERSRVFTSVSRDAGSDADILLKIISTESKQDLRMTMALTDMKSRQRIVEYQSSVSFPGMTAKRGDAAQRALADLRRQMLADYSAGKGVAAALAAQRAPQAGSLVSRPTLPASATLRSSLMKDPAADEAYRSAMTTNTVAAYEEFLNQHPQSEHRPKALAALAGLLTSDGGSESDYKYFLKKYPDGAAYLPLEQSFGIIGPPGLTVLDIIKEKKQGTADRLIISKIRSSGGTYKDFSFDEIKLLHEKGLSDDIIEAMIDVTTKARTRP